MDYRQRIKIQNSYKKKIQDMLPDLENTSGIYIFTRNEDDKKKAYIGQAKHLINRLVDHCMRYEQHIDKSLKKHGLYSKNNIDGWQISYLYCTVWQLDIQEKYMIKRYKNLGYELYNITGGGQGKGKVDIAERNNTKLKSYANGKVIGETKLMEKIKTFFDKYLDFTIKGKPTKIKERKYNEFKDLIGDNENE